MKATVPDEIETVNINTACRICLIDVQPKIHVRVNDRIKSSGNVTYLDLFKDLCGFDVIPLEPQHFCAECAKKLKMMHELKEKCVETQTTLEEWVKTEPEDAESVQEVDYIFEDDDDEPMLDSETPQIKYENLEFLDDAPRTSLISSDPDLRQEYHDCEHCPSSFRTKQGLRVHYRFNHPNENSHECPHCKKKLFSPFIGDHVKNCQQAQSPSVCPVCGIIVNRKQISRHIESHNVSNTEKGKKPYKCDICGVRTLEKSGMASHMKIQHLNYRVRCPVCFSDFKTPSVLTSHIRRYHPEKKSPLKCKFCDDFTTTDASVMHRHHLYHTGKKQHKCEVCGREFRAKDVLRDHMTTHSDERPFPCAICKSAFKTKKALGVHMKTHRAHEYECPVCQKTYLTNQQMRNHVKKFHADYELPPPGTIFNKNWRIRKAREEMKEMAIKEGVDATEADSFVIMEPPPIETKMYFRTNYVTVDRIEEI